MGEASHPAPPSTATTHEVVLRADFWEGIAEASEQAPSTAASCVFSQAEWVKAVDKTFPRPLTRLLNGEAVKLVSKLAEPWSAFQKLRPSARLGGRVRPNMSVANLRKACDSLDSRRASRNSIQSLPCIVRLMCVRTD